MLNGFPEMFLWQATYRSQKETRRLLTWALDTIPEAGRSYRRTRNRLKQLLNDLPPEP